MPDSDDPFYHRNHVLEMFAHIFACPSAASVNFKHAFNGSGQKISDAETIVHFNFSAVYFGGKVRWQFDAIGIPGEIKEHQLALHFCVKLVEKLEKDHAQGIYIQFLIN